MGKLAKPAATTVSVDRQRAPWPAARSTLNLSSTLCRPRRPDHFFLNLMLDQWRDAPHKDAPAMLQADRALALASTQVKLYRDEFLTQAMWAVTHRPLDDAGQALRSRASKIDPNDHEAAAGLALVEKLKTGKVTRADLEQKIAAKVGRAEGDRRTRSPAT